MSSGNLTPFSHAVLILVGNDGAGAHDLGGAALLAGSVALTSHGAKATTRAAANTSPEPVSNWALSILEDGVSVFLVWMAAEYPLLTAGLVVVLVILALLAHVPVRRVGDGKNVRRLTTD